MEEARVEIRNLRRDAADQLKKRRADGERRHRRGAPPARDAPADDRPPHRRGRPRRRGQGTGGPRGLVARAPLVRPTDAPPAAHEPAPRRSAAVRRRSARPARRRSCRPTTCRGTSRSSWTATGAGPAPRGLSELEGHAAGVEAIRELLRHAVRRGVPVLTLYAFSRENWARTDDEVDRAVRAARGGDPERDRRAPRAGRPGPPARPARRAARRDAGVDRRGARRDGRRRRGCCSTSRSTTPAGPSSSTPFRRLVASGVAPDDDRRGDDQRGAVHGRPARPRPRHPDRRRAAPLQLPDLAVGLRRVLLTATRSGPTSGPTRSTPPCSSSPAAPPLRPLTPDGLSAMRQRAISAAVLVPPCSSSCALGGVGPRRRRSRSSRARRDRGLPPPDARPATPPFAGARHRARPRRRRSTRRSRSVPRGRGPPARRPSGSCSSAIGGVHPTGPARRPRGLDGDRLRGAVRRRCSAFVVRLGARPRRPSPAERAARLPRRRARLDPRSSSCAVWAFDTGAYLVGKRFGRTQFLTHISPSKTLEGVVGGVVADDGRRRAAALGARPAAAPRAACSGR